MQKDVVTQAVFRPLFDELNLECYESNLNRMADWHVNLMDSC